MNRSASDLLLTDVLTSGPQSRMLLCTYLQNEIEWLEETLVRLRFLADNFLLFW